MSSIGTFDPWELAFALRAANERRPNASDRAVRRVTDGMRSSGWPARQAALVSCQDLLGQGLYSYGLVEER